MASSTGNANPGGKGKRSRDNRNLIYGNALPIIPEKSGTWPSRALNILGFSLTTISNPRCVGIFDIKSRSVWIVNERDTNILWQRGFFGKGNLSRSEPSWLARRINQLNGIRGMSADLPSYVEITSIYSSCGFKVLTAEELTAKRREERKLFKAERAQAIAAAAAEAETKFATEGRPPTPPVENISTTVRANLAQRTPLASGGEILMSKEPTLKDDDIPPPENMEHLQLTLQEAFFLSWGLDCLQVLEPESVSDSSWFHGPLSPHLIEYVQLARRENTLTFLQPGINT